MRIVFTSCCDPLLDASQVAWDHVRQLSPAPDHLVLMGDNMYMDLKFGHGGHHTLRKLRGKMSVGQFAQAMHAEYARQWAVPSFQRAIQAPQVHAIWDDHDFAWNNSRGAGADDLKEYVPDDKRCASRQLFQQFRQALIDKPATYPGYALGDATNLPDLGSIADFADLVPGEVRLHLLDCRSFRSTPGSAAGLLGAPQRAQLDSRWLPAPKLNIVVSSVTLQEEWAQFDGDVAWLKGAAATHRILMLSGDIHEPRFDARFGVLEATASPLAQPATVIFGKSNQVFGVLDLEPHRLTVTLWREGQVFDPPRSVDLANWPGAW